MPAIKGGGVVAVGDEHSRCRWSRCETALGGLFWLVWGQRDRIVPAPHTQSRRTHAEAATLAATTLV